MSYTEEAHKQIRNRNIDLYDLDVDLTDHRLIDEDQGVLTLNGATIYALVYLNDTVYSVTHAVKIDYSTPQLRFFNDENGELIQVIYKDLIKKVIVKYNSIEVYLKENYK